MLYRNHKVSTSGSAIKLLGRLGYFFLIILAFISQLIPDVICTFAVATLGPDDGSSYSTISAWSYTKHISSLS